MWPAMVMCASVARVGLPFTSERRLPPSQVCRMVGESVLPSRAMTFRTLANSSSITNSRLSSTPWSTSTS